MSRAEDTAKRIMNELEEQSDSEKARMVARYMKTSSHRFLGVTVTEIREVTKKRIRDLDTDTLLPLMKRLWSQKVFDFRIAAIQSMERFSSEGDVHASVEMISQWIDDADTWSIIDPLCTVCLGTLIIRSPQVEQIISGWRSSDNIWRRRATVVPYLHLAKKSIFREEYSSRILSGIIPHLQDDEFFVAKAVGWVLRELSRRDPSVVRDFIYRNRDNMVPLSVREGSKALRSSAH